MFVAMLPFARVSINLMISLHRSRVEIDLGYSGCDGYQYWADSREGRVTIELHEIARLVHSTLVAAVTLRAKIGTFPSLPQCGHVDARKLVVIVVIFGSR